MPNASPFAAIEAALASLSSAVQAQNQAVSNATAFFAQSDATSIVEALDALTASVTASTSALQAAFTPAMPGGSIITPVPTTAPPESSKP